MKIPLEYNSEKIRLYVTATVKINNKVPIPILFLIDTGSPFTFVDEFNTAKIRLFANNLKFHKDMLLAGTKVGLYSVESAHLSFVTEDNTLFTAEYNELKVSKTEWTRKASVYASTSLIGMDFLLKNGYTLFLDPNRGIAYIDTGT